MLRFLDITILFQELGAHVKVLLDISFETVDNGCCIVEKCSDVGWCDVCSSPIERDAIPTDELIFSAMIVIVLGEEDGNAYVRQIMFAGRKSYVVDQRDE